MPTINITVVQASPKSAISQKGKPYNLVELAYKNHSFQNKLEEVKINQYSKVFGEVSKMQPGQSFDVLKEKDESGYFQWLSVTPSAGEAAVSVGPGGLGLPQSIPANFAAKPAFQANSYPTAEERAQTQVYIVKQSSITAAVNLLTTGAKIPPSTELVLQQAQKFVDFVFEDKRTPTDNLLDSPIDDEVE